MVREVFIKETIDRDVGSAGQGHGGAQGTAAAGKWKWPGERTQCRAGGSGPEEGARQELAAVQGQGRCQACRGRTSHRPREQEGLWEPHSSHPLPLPPMPSIGEPRQKPEEGQVTGSLSRTRGKMEKEGLGARDKWPRPSTARPTAQARRK